MNCGHSYQQHTSTCRKSNKPSDSWRYFFFFPAALSHAILIINYYQKPCGRRNTQPLLAHCCSSTVACVDTDQQRSRRAPPVVNQTHRQQRVTPASHEFCFSTSAPSLCHEWFTLLAFLHRLWWGIEMRTRPDSYTHTGSRARTHTHKI